MHQAAWSKVSIDIIEFLVSMGADVNAKNNEDITPLHITAFDNPDVNIVKYLVSQGANVNATQKVDRNDDYGDTPLHDAAKNNTNPEVVRYLVSVRGVNVNLKNRASQTPFDKANSEEKKAILRAAGGKSGR